ncbi:lipid A 1-diphosphate synthase [Litchfieldella qijiaojingensis]|uniref:Lipid A 1-diphosphate synthase n=1 Tax=Litchfieldella qijiaojingensis TaxID=980347 RepID=A0ABQ2YVD9_9GAMM|nr:phosphatase PAP2 family protein [Halomonas qijiaojingensis]GGX94433.1 lipid A 1-diphosphate synthase [Halomonas qijiaojingensis]
MPVSHPSISLPRTLFYNLLGIALVLSWWSPNILIWEYLDDAIFFTTNAWLHDANTLWVAIVALLNNRLFDVGSMLLLLGLFVWAMARDPVREHRLLRWGGIGITMLLTAGLLNRAVRYAISYTHPSPTLVYDNTNLLTDLVDFSTKAVSSNSFPGDHGMMLMLFTAFLWRFSGRTVGLVSALCVVILSAPRILGGAHWFSDVYMGALAISLVALPWVLCTPVAPAVALRITDILIRTKQRLPIA